MVFLNKKEKNCDDDLEYIMIQGKWKKKIRLQNIQGHQIYAHNMNSTMCFQASLLMISFEDLNLIFYIWVFNTTVEVIMERKNPT
jgi:hypothetical protein